MGTRFSARLHAQHKLAQSRTHGLWPTHSSLDTLDLITVPGKRDSEQATASMTKQDALAEIVSDGARIHRASSLTEKAEWSLLRIRCAHVLNSEAYKIFMAAAIFLNSTVVIFETDVRARKEAIPPWLLATNFLMMVAYTAELAVRLYVLRFDFFRVSLNIFEAAMISLDILSEILLLFVDKLPSISVLRVLRILRVVRVLRQFLVFRELYLMLAGLVSALRAIFYATLIIVVVLIMWSVVVVELMNDLNVGLADAGEYGDCQRCRDAFSSVRQAFLTFLQTVIAGDSWGLLALPLMDKEPWTGFIIISVLLSMQLGLMNLIVAIIVDRAAEVREQDSDLMHIIKQEELHQSFLRLVQIFDSIDVDGSGTLTLQECQEAYATHPEFAQMFQVMDISAEDMIHAFEIMDRDANGEVDYKEFVEQLHRMQTCDTHTLLVFVKHHVDAIGVRLKDQEKHQASIIKRLDEHGRALAEIGTQTRGNPNPQSANGGFTLRNGVDDELPQEDSPFGLHPPDRLQADALVRDAQCFDDEMQQKIEALQRRIDTSLASVADEVSRALDYRAIAYSLRSPRSEDGKSRLESTGVRLQEASIPGSNDEPWNKCLPGCQGVERQQERVLATASRAKLSPTKMVRLASPAPPPKVSVWAPSSQGLAGGRGS